MLNNYFLRGARKRFWHLVWCLLASSLAAAQPTLVKDIATSGTDPLTGANSFKPNSLTGVNGVVYFSAFDPVNGRELWRSDGTAAGTFMLRDIVPGATGSEPANLAAVNNTLYFSANDGKNGRELWRTDGTSVGTVRVKDIAGGAASSSPTSLVNVGGTLYFSANDGASGRELWKSDGTSGGTVRVKDILVGTNGAGPAYLISMSGTLYFTASDGVSGVELWKSNGTAAGTARVKDIVSGSTSSNPTQLITGGGMLYFVVNGQLWKSNGTSAGTVPITNFPADYFQDQPSQLTFVNGTLYFTAFAYANELGEELFKSDGTAEGTVLVKDIEPYRHDRWGDYYSSNPRELTNVNGTLYFVATCYNDMSGTELWASDGTEAGTGVAVDFAPDTYWVESPGWGPSGERPYHGNPTNLTNVNGTLYCTTASGLWKLGGNGPELLNGLQDVSNLIYSNGTVFLTGRDNAGGTELWKSNGTSTGTVRVEGKASRLPAGGNPQYALDMGGTLYFAAGSLPGGMNSGRVMEPM
jgi:ELWxxDGT repeat protein